MNKTEFVFLAWAVHTLMWIAGIGLLRWASEQQSLLAAVGILVGAIMMFAAIAGWTVVSWRYLNEK